MENETYNFELQTALKEYIDKKHNQDQCIGFIAGFKAGQESIKNKLKYT